MKRLFLFLLTCCVLNFEGNAQQNISKGFSTTKKSYLPQLFYNRFAITDTAELYKKQQNKYNRFYQYGIAKAFVGGLYKGTQTLKKLKQKGGFGLGAPDLLDGELTILNGKVYQTKANGKTIEPSDDFKTSFAFVTFFKAGTTLYFEKKIAEKKFIKRLDSLLKNKNGMYAIKVSGTFQHIKTRAFPPVENEPFPALVTILDRQQFFEFSKIKGTLVGFYIPEYLNNINISGFHFHFLSKNKNHGGHVLDFIGKNLKVEIAKLKGFELETPNNKSFQNFKFNTKENKDLQRVEQGQ